MCFLWKGGADHQLLLHDPLAGRTGLSGGPFVGLRFGPKLRDIARTVCHCGAEFGTVMPTRPSAASMGRMYQALSGTRGMAKKSISSLV